MIDRIRLRFLWLFLSLGLAFQAFSTPSETPTSDKTNVVAHKVAPVSPGKYDGSIAWVTATMLEKYHYSHQALDRSMSSKFLDRYIEALDPQHLHFLQSDLDDFEEYRRELGDLTVNNRHSADLTPAFQIFNRFMQRLEQHVNYVDDLLKTEKFTFDTDERIAISRKEMPYPKNLAEAQKLWRDRLRSEFLQEKLNKMTAKKKLQARKLESSKTVKDSKSKSQEEEIADTLSHSYRRSLKNYTDWGNDDVLQIYLETLAHLYDPHSDYMGPQPLEQFAIGMNLRLSGIGAQLASKDGYCTIDKLLDGYPAAKSKKIKEKDRIIAVAQADKAPVDVVDMPLNKVVHLIRGPKGTEVRLTIVPDGAPLSETVVVSLTREDIKLEDQAAKAKLIDMPGADGKSTRVGVIDLKSFYAPFDFSGPKPPELAHERGEGAPVGGKSTSEDVLRLINKLKQEKVQGIVLDLRYNGGGSLEEAVKLTGLFIKDGPVVQVKDYKGDIQKETDDDSSVAYDGPLIVLTSRFSASASEIVAGALQDYGRALVVGDSSTHGKGSVQSVNFLQQIMNLPTPNDPGALKLTIKKFYRASGASTQLRGVTPDIVLPSIFNESKEIGEASLDNPLAWDTVPPAKYEPYNMVTNYLSELRGASQKRLNNDKDYAYIREDIEIYNKRQADKTLSLNEKQRIKENEEDDARQKARKKERHSRPEPVEKVYELSLRQAAQPGLPAPVQRTNIVASTTTNLNGTGSVQISNSASTVTANSLPPINSEDDEDESPTAVDPALNEAEHILMDYVRLLKDHTLATTATAIH
jgi:carboxyl-terminal processing protease